MAASLLSSLKVITRPNIEHKPPVLRKRLKLIDKLEQQKEMAVCMLENRRFEAFREKRVKDPQTGDVSIQRRPTTIRPWYYDSDNHYYLEVKVHNRPIELQKGKHAIDIGDKSELPDVIETIIKAVEQGELDTFLQQPVIPKKAKAVTKGD
ncbi:hypothetical protein EYS14_24760 [Alteromonadaceae bacterium M269]|nr:hypothetical protein EYS14_24760 [Alteromonadaceae bacterium M269]